MSIEDYVNNKLKRAITTSNGCIEWPGPYLGKGKRYGCVNYNYTRQLAHRVVYIMNYGEIPKGKELHHTCKNGKCVNPLHLEAVLHSTNIARSNEYASKNKLSYSIADAIRKEYEKGETNHRSLAKKYGVHKSTITRLLAKEAWYAESVTE